MISAANNLRNEYVKYLIRRKLSNVVFSHENSDGEFMVYIEGDVHKSLAERSQCLKTINDYKSELKSLSMEHLVERYWHEIEREKQEYAELDKSYFFSQPHAQADFSYWAKMPAWALDEGAALSFGKNPEVVNKRTLLAISSLSPFVKNYNRRFEQLSRLAQDVEFPCEAGRILELLASIDISFPQELEKLLNLQNDRLDAISRLNQEIQSLKAENEQLRNKKLHPKAEESMLKIIAGLLHVSYGHSPTEGRSTIAKEVTEDLLKIGLTLDEDTVRKYLRQALEFIPKNYINQGL